MGDFYGAYRGLVMVLGLAGLVLAGGLTGAGAQTPGAPDIETTVYTNGYWWTGAGFEHGDRAVNDGFFVPLPDDADDGSEGIRYAQIAQVDVGGAFVIPPFGEAHNHNINAPIGPFGVDVMVERYLADGIFYVKIPNAFAPYATAIRPKLNRPDSVDVAFSMGGITRPGGHPGPLYRETLRRYMFSEFAADDFIGQAYHVISRRGDVARALDRLEVQGADFVKIFLLFTTGPGERQGLSGRVAQRVVQQAHERGLQVTAHVETANDFRAAVAAGVDEIAHLPGYTWRDGASAKDYRLTPEDAAAAAEAGVVVVTTTVISRQFYLGRPGALAQVQKLQRDNLRVLDQAGVVLAIGSDDMVHTARAEIENLRQMAVFDDAKLLTLWINTPRASIFPAREISCLEVGCEASFLALGSDPFGQFDMLHAVGDVRLAVKDGDRLGE